MSNFKKTVNVISLLGLFIIIISWQLDNYRKNLLVLKDANGNFRTIRNKDDWYRRREQILDSIQLVMGPLPDDSHKVPLAMKVSEEKNIGGIRVLRLPMLQKKMTGSGLPVYSIRCKGTCTRHFVPSSDNQYWKVRTCRPWW